MKVMPSMVEFDFIPEGIRVRGQWFPILRMEWVDGVGLHRYIERHLGRTVRLNLYHGAYFGGDWLSTTICLEPNHQPGAPAIACRKLFNAP